MQPLISVIIPIYKVEKYLSKCIDSVLSQTYKNLEIILVNDGSPDKCGVICEEYAEKDARIRVIHKENGGLSSARNAGIDICKGDFISFIDSDDIVSPYFIEFLFEGVLLNDSDIVTCGWSVNFHDSDESVIEFAKNEKDFELKDVTVDNALLMLLYQKIPNGAQHRLYRKEIFCQLRFPLGYLFEDVATVDKAFILAKKMSMVKSNIYGYRLRDDGIVRMKFNESKMVAIPIGTNLIKEIEEYNPIFKKAAVARAFSLCFQVFLQVPEDDIKNKQLLWNEIKKYRVSVLLNMTHNLRMKNRIAAFISLFGMKPTYMICKSILYKEKNK